MRHCPRCSHAIAAYLPQLMIRTSNLPKPPTSYPIKLGNKLIYRTLPVSNPGLYYIYYPKVLSPNRMHLLVGWDRGHWARTIKMRPYKNVTRSRTWRIQNRCWDDQSRRLSVSTDRQSIQMLRVCYWLKLLTDVQWSGGWRRQPWCKGYKTSKNIKVSCENRSYKVNKKVVIKKSFYLLFITNLELKT